MTHIRVPHFDLPFRIDQAGEGVTTVEQDSVEDVANCVEAALRYVKGQRLDEPTFGITEPTFDAIPISTDRIVAEVLEHEPRAILLIESEEIKPAELYERVRVRISPREGE